VISNHRVRGAFTRGGFQFMQQAIENPSQIAGEEWVLGKITASELDPVSFEQKMRQRYYQDFVNEWRTVLETSAVAGYRDFADADRKLEKLTSPTSPLLEVLRFVSYNTDVAVADITDVFQPVVAVEPPAPPDEYQFQSNKPYIDALAKLKGDLSTLAHSSNTSDPAVINQALGSAGTAKATITQIMGVRIDQRFHTEGLVRILLEEPITSAEALLGRAPKEGTNAAGRDFCEQFNSMLNKYPLNPAAREELSTDQLNAMLEPSKGALWSFYNTKLAQLIVKQGSRYSAASGGALKVSQPFLDFFNRAADLSSAFYPNGSTTPRFSYTLKQLPSNVDGLVLKIGSETLSGTCQQKTFTWTGNADDVLVSTKGALLNSSTGSWAVFHFIAGAHAHALANVTNLEWIQQSNGQTIMLPGGKPESYDYQLQVAGFNPFRAADLSGLRCVPAIVH
jgi:type VI secretion system protein ImpL